MAKQLIVDKSEDMRPTLDTIAPVYIYLHWISTGCIECVESGGHYRPNKHAELSRIMFRSLEWVAGDNARLPMERVTARRMQVRPPRCCGPNTHTLVCTKHTLACTAMRLECNASPTLEASDTARSRLHTHTPARPNTPPLRR